MRPRRLVDLNFFPLQNRTVLFGLGNFNRRQAAVVLLNLDCDLLRPGVASDAVQHPNTAEVR